MTTCDKCGKPVDPSNDASILEAIFAGEPAIAVWMVGRHLLPVEGCQGSPSRAQYLEGRPRDTRGYPSTYFHFSYRFFFVPKSTG